MAKAIALQVNTVDGEHWLTFRTFPHSLNGFRAAVKRKAWWTHHFRDAKYRVHLIETD
jgi:hypothetical protein